MSKRKQTAVGLRLGAGTGFRILSQVSGSRVFFLPSGPEAGSGLNPSGPFLETNFIGPPAIGRMSLCPDG